MGFWESTLGEALQAIGLMVLMILLVYLVLTGRMRRDRRRAERDKQRKDTARVVNRLTAGRAGGEGLEVIKLDPTGEGTSLPDEDEATLIVNGLLRRPPPH